jgi:hypothetical protein
MTQAPDDSDLLVQFERDNIKDDYRVYYTTKRNNFFASIQNFPQHWEFFCRLDEIWLREVKDLAVLNSERGLPAILYFTAHAKIRVMAELAFSMHMTEARSILRDAVETVSHAHHMISNPNNQKLWLEKNEPAGRQAFNKVFRDNKKTGLFADLPELNKQYDQLSEAGSHPTLLSLVNRASVEGRDGERYMAVNYSGAADRAFFARELFTRLLTCALMERTFFADFSTRFELDARLIQMRRDFEIFKEEVRQTVKAGYEAQRPSTAP